MTITQPQITALREVQATIGAGNAAKGFHEEGDALRKARYGTPGFDHEYDEGDVRALRNYYSEKLLLIVSEVTEAHDEIRSGREVEETYYPTAIHDEDDPTVVDTRFGPYKPEGVPSELADVVIRCFDFADEAGIDLAAMIAEKTLFNATRPFRHGKKF